MGDFAEKSGCCGFGGTGFKMFRVLDSEKGRFRGLGQFTVLSLATKTSRNEPSKPQDKSSLPRLPKGTKAGNRNPNPEP